MNDYEAKQAARAAYYQDKARAAKEASLAAYQSSRQAVDGIPMGQPILIGHHSERRHRAALNRSEAAMRRSCEEQRKAEFYERKAAAVGRGGISSDDPEAVDKLREQLARLESVQARMKAINAALRKKTEEAKTAALIALGMTAEEAGRVIEAGAFPAYCMTNNGANMRRLAQRIEQLEALRQRETYSADGEGYSYREDAAENRVLFQFDGKPGEEIRALLRGAGFKWSPSRSAWVRKITPAALNVGRDLCRKIAASLKN